MAELLEAVAIDREKLSRMSAVVTGSNGKGSTAAFCASIGRASGLRTGLFTSPHLFRVNERFQIDGVPIANHDLIRLKLQIETAIGEISRRRGERFGSFEAMFALACPYFQQNDCDFAVFEAGIGGRYDPVRLVGAHVTCVTSIDTEHVELLGNTLELIAFDKSDACAAGGTIVYGENCRNLKPHLLEYNRTRGVTALFVRDQIGIDGESATPSAQQFDFAFATRSPSSMSATPPTASNNRSRACKAFMAGKAGFSSSAFPPTRKSAKSSVRWRRPSTPSSAPRRTTRV